MVDDVTDPNATVSHQYINNRDFDSEPGSGTAGDVGVGHLTFVYAEDSPNGASLFERVK